MALGVKKKETFLVFQFQLYLLFCFIIYLLINLRVWGSWNQNPKSCRHQYSFSVSFLFDSFFIFLPQPGLLFISPSVFSVTKRSGGFANIRNDAFFFLHSYHISEISRMFLELGLISFYFLFISNISVKCTILCHFFIFHRDLFNWLLADFLWNKMSRRFSETRVWK